MRPAPSSAAASRRMQANRGKDTSPELAIRRELHRLGLRFRLHRKLIPGSRRTVDIVFAGPKIAVFVDGCYWHGCPTHGTNARANSEFWRNKIETNQRRDADTDEILTSAGWTVVRVWEHEDALVAAQAIRDLVTR